jgi:hypothetical protein
LRAGGGFVAAGRRGTAGSGACLALVFCGTGRIACVLRPARRFVPLAGRRDEERARSAGQQVIVAASPLAQPDGMGHLRR